MAGYETCVWGRRAAESSTETGGGEVSGTTSHGVWAAAPSLHRAPRTCQAVQRDRRGHGMTVMTIFSAQGCAVLICPRRILTLHRCLPESVVSSLIKLCSPVQMCLQTSLSKLMAKVWLFLEVVSGHDYVQTTDTSVQTNKMSQQGLVPGSDPEFALVF